MTRPTKQLVQEFYAQMSYTPGKHANASLLSIENARRMLDFAPEFSGVRPLGAEALRA